MPLFFNTTQKSTAAICVSDAAMIEFIIQNITQGRDECLCVCVCVELMESLPELKDVGGAY